MLSCFEIQVCALSGCISYFAGAIVCFPAFVCFSCEMLTLFLFHLRTHTAQPDSRLLRNIQAVSRVRYKLFHPSILPTQKWCFLYYSNLKRSSLIEHWRNLLPWDSQSLKLGELCSHFFLVWEVLKGQGWFLFLYRSRELILEGTQMLYYSSATANIAAMKTAIKF